MEGVMRESDKRPAEWRFVTLTETRRGKFNVCLPYTYSRIDRGILKAMKVDPETKTEGLSLKAATELGWTVERWIRVQEGAAEPKGLRRKGV